MRSANLRDFKAHLSRYLRLVEGGDAVALTRNGRAIALLVRPPGTARRPGKMSEAEWWDAALREGVMLSAPEKGTLPEPDSSARRLAGGVARRFLRDRRK